MHPDLDLGLSGRVAVVTGAASGVGAEVALLLAASGARVVGCDIDVAGLNKVFAALTEPSRHIAMETDIASVSECRTLINDAADRFGRLDILVNVAAILHRQDFFDVEESDFQHVVDVNLRSQFFLCQAALPFMAAANWGRIVNFTSPAGFIGARYRTTSYAVSKAGLLGLTRSLARQYGGANICVNLVSPGGVDTPMGRQALEGEDQVAFLRTIPMGRLAQPREIAYGALFLVSEWARYVSGHVLVVDGAATMHA